MDDGSSELIRSADTWRTRDGRRFTMEGYNSPVKYVHCFMSVTRLYISLVLALSRLVQSLWSL